MDALPLSAAVPQAASAEWALVLDAAGIRYEARAEPGGVSLWVAPEDHARAIVELTQYFHERRAPARPREWPRHRHASWAVIGYALALLAVAIAALSDLGMHDWYGRGVLDPGFLARGEWWRAITALTLHTGTLHLASNLVFGAVFVYAAGQMLGAGLALLLILAGAGLANTADALVHPAGHVMLGASTAVFTALGLVAALAWRRRAQVWPSLRERVAPVVAGLALLAMTGTAGEQTDIVAHLFGFIAGLGLGAVAAGLPLPAPGRSRPQWVAAGAAVALLAAAWIAALS